MLKRGLLSLVLLVLAFPLAVFPAQAADKKREVVTSENGDYFGFDLRSEKDVSLDQCKSICLEDDQSRAFTYNSKA